MTSSPKPTQFSLEGKVALVTGASRGIGEAIARGLAEAGARVAIAARKPEPLEAVAEELRAAGHDVRAYPAHAGRGEEVEALVAAIERDFGGLDVAVANAAANPYFGPMLGAEASHWDKTFEVNVKGAFFLARAAVPRMKARGGGSFLVTTSIAASHPLEGLGIYSTTKAALVMMVKVLALELAPHAIRVNALAPGVIDTKFSSALLADDDMRRHAVAEVPLGRIGLPHDIAGTAVFLASDASAFVTGQTLVIDGGQTL